MSHYKLETWKAHLLKDHKGTIKKNVTNLMLHLQHLEPFGSTIRFNELTQQVEWDGKPYNEQTDDVKVAMILDDANFEPPKASINSAIVAHAKMNSYHPVRDYLNSLRWDNLNRIDDWLIRFFGAEDTPFNRLASRKFLIGAVARAFEPGCKVDAMMILEGPQGIKKSSGIEALFSPSFYTASVSLFKDHQKMVMQTFGAWVIELPEFAAVMRKDMNFIKGLMTITTDKVPLPYARTISEHPRQFITVATYNPEEDEGYLDDSTGNRRFWPVAVTKVDIQGIKKYRDQLWAEARKAYMDGERWWFEGEEEEAIASANVNDRESTDAWMDVLKNKLDPTMHYGYADIYVMLSITNDRVNRETKARVRRAMKALGYQNLPRKMENGRSERRWMW
jgi:putative DNA primase/helicase